MHLYKKTEENDWTLKFECVEQHFIDFVVTQIAPDEEWVIERWITWIWDLGGLTSRSKE